MGLVLPSVKVTLPPPELRERAPYEEREITILTTPASETLQWAADLAEMTGAGDALLEAFAGGNPGLVLQAVTRLGGKRTQDMLDRLLKYTTITYQRRRLELSSREAFDEAFSGELLLLSHVVIAVARHMFESFSRGLAPAREPTAT